MCRVYEQTQAEGGREEMSDIVERYGDKREKRGEKRTRIGDVKSLMETMTLTVDQALDALKIQGKERESIIKAVQG